MTNGTMAADPAKAGSARIAALEATGVAAGRGALRQGCGSTGTSKLRLAPDSTSSGCRAPIVACTSRITSCRAETALGSDHRRALEGGRRRPDSQGERHRPRRHSTAPTGSRPGDAPHDTSGHRRCRQGWPLVRCVGGVRPDGVHQAHRRPSAARGQGLPGSRFPFRTSLPSCWLGGAPSLSLRRSPEARQASQPVARRASRARGGRPAAARISRATRRAHPCRAALEARVGIAPITTNTRRDRTPSAPTRAPAGTRP